MILGADILKLPLRFQVTEFDCGTTSLQNALSYLYEREEIPAELIKIITDYTLDCYDENGNLGQGGTSIKAMELIVSKLSDYCIKNKFNLSCYHLKKDKVKLNKIKECLSKNGCVIIRTYLKEPHYVLITSIDEKYIYIWDSYFLNKNFFRSDSQVKLITNNNYQYNRKITKERIDSYSKKDYSLGPINTRECIFFNKIESR